MKGVTRKDVRQLVPMMRPKRVEEQPFFCACDGREKEGEVREEESTGKRLGKEEAGK